MPRIGRVLGVFGQGWGWVFGRSSLGQSVTSWVIGLVDLPPVGAGDWVGLAGWLGQLLNR